MKRVLALTRTLLQDWIRNREAVFFALLFPLLLLLIFSVVFGGGPTQFDVGVQNNDLTARGEPTELSAALMTAIEGAPPLEPHHVDPDLDLANAENVEDATGYKRVLRIPAGFDDRVRASSARVRMTVIRDTMERIETQRTTAEGTTVEGALEGIETEQLTVADADQVTLTLRTVPDDEAAGAVRSLFGGVVATFNDRSIGVEEPTVGIVTQERGPAGQSGAEYFLPAFIVAMILINGVMTVPSTVSEYKRDGTLKRLAVTPLRRHEWVLANVVQQSILAVALAVVLIAVAWVAFGVRTVPGPLAIGLIVLGAVAFSSLGMIVGSVIRTPGSAISLGGAIALPLMFVSGIFWELDLMPPPVQRIATYSPVTHFHRSLRELLILDSTDGVVLTAGLLAGLAVVCFAGAVAATSWRDFE
jgi:ABC-2 type transport system permease protein